MNDPVPEKTYQTGWPEFLEDNDGNEYVLLRDGAETSPNTGEVCLYGLLDADRNIIREYQWVPVLGATAADMRLSGGTWMEPEEFIRYGQTPIRIPEEPVRIPRR